MGKSEKRKRLVEDLEAHLYNETSYTDFAITGTLKGGEAGRSIPDVAARLADLFMKARGAAKRHEQNEEHGDTRDGGSSSSDS